MLQYISGLVHTDDGIALKQIAAALTVENDFEETPNVCACVCVCMLYNTHTSHINAHLQTHMKT